jgi:hypothetical protein
MTIVSNKEYADINCIYGHCNSSAPAVLDIRVLPPFSGRFAASAVKYFPLQKSVDVAAPTLTTCGKQATDLLKVHVRNRWVG